MPIDEDKLRELMGQLEADWIERTRSASKTDKLAEAICAFANDLPNHGRPGYVLIGVDDKTGAAVGASIGDEVLKRTSLADDVAQDKEISGDLLTILRELDMLIDVQVQSRPVAETALREQAVVDYPKAAIREILMNAIMHRDYEVHAPVRFYWFADRIEIQNPGGLYGAAAYDFRRQNDYRNPVLAEAMKILGYVNRYGRGVIRAERELLQNGNPTPEFDFSSGPYTLVTMRRAP